MSKLKHKTCDLCHTTKKISEFYFYKTRQTYHNRCFVCFRNYYAKRFREYYQRVKDSPTFKLHQKIDRTKNKEKWKARTQTRYAIQKGIIKKPLKCESCKEIKPLHAHHSDYSKPLEVMFLCTLCHAKVHKLLREKSN